MSTRHSSLALLRQFRQTVWAMLLGEFLSRITYFMAWPFVIIILNQQMGESAFSVGLLLGVSAAISAVMGIYIGYLSDKFGRKVMLVAGCLLMAVCFLMLTFADGFWWFFVVMALMGLGQPAIEVCAKAIISDSLADRQVREFALYLRYFLINVSGAIGGIIGLIVSLNSPDAIFIATTATYLGYLLWVSILLSNHRTTSSDNLPNFVGMLGVIRQDGVFLYLLLANFLMIMVYAQLGTTLPQIISLSGIEQVAQFIMMIYIINFLAVIIFQFPLLSLLKAFSASRRAQIGLGVMLSSQLIFMVMDMSSVWAWGVAVFILSIGEAIVIPTISVNIDELAKPELRGSYFGAANLSEFGMSLGAVLGGFVIGTLSDTAYFAITSLACVACVLIYQKIVRYQAKLRHF
ncbi:MAG: MFS transporter [Moraxella sp.]|nr:MFS transporter [Moraxella sp.]